MATPFRLKRSSVASKRPGLTDLQKGELALNFYDGHLFAERDTAGVGIGTTIANLTPWKETFGGAAINYENSVGIGSTNPTGRLDVFGLTVLDEVKVSGFSTFTDTVGITSNLKVSGISSITNTFYFTGITTGREIFFQPSENRIQFKDHAKAVFGTGNKFQIYHNGSSAFVHNFTGNLELQAPANSTIDLNRTAHLEEGLNVTAGVSTFAATVKASDRLEVDGVTDLDELTVTGFSTFSGQVGLNTHVDINDHSRLRFGDGVDLQIYHDGANSYVSDQGTGDLRLSGNVVKLNNTDNTATMVKATQGGSVELNYDGSKKFETTGVGVSILNGIGATFATISAPAELIIDPAAVGDNTGLVRIKGDLYVDGTEFIVDSETIKLADHVVGIASTSTTDALTDGAGIGIGTNKFFTFDNSNTAFKSTENINLESGHSYKIDGSDALSADTLGAGVINSSLTNLGTLTHLNVTGVTTSTGGFRAGTGGTTFTTKSGRVGINTSQASDEHMLEVYGNINIVGDDVEYYQNGQRRTAGVGIHSRGTVVAGLGATIIDFVGTAVSSILFSDVGIATVNLRKTTFSRDTTSFTATSGQTSFSLSYTPGFIDVYVNGIRLTAAEFTASNGSSVVLNTGAFAGDIVDITAFVDDGFAVGGKWSPQDGTPSNIFYSTGNVGVHSTSPKVTLDVVGEARVTGVVTAGAYLVGGNQVISSARQLQNIASLDSTTTATIESAIANAPNTFTDLKVSGIATFSNNVDIDGHTELDDLNVSGFSTFSSAVRVNTTSGARAVTFNAPTLGPYVTFEVAGTAKADLGPEGAALGVGSTDRFLINARQARDIALRTNNTERLTITGGGRVGLGITTPRALVDFGSGTGNGTLNQTASNYQAVFEAPTGTGNYTRNIAFVVGTSSTVSAAINAIDEGGNNATGLIVATGTEGAIAERLRIKSNGQVGIGTDMAANAASNYGFAVHRESGTGYLYTETAESGASAGLRAKAGTADFTIFTTQGTGQFAIYDNTNTAERFRITSTGLVGIGSTAPKGDVDIGEEFTLHTTTTTVSSTAATAIDTLAIAKYRSSRFQVQITQGTDYQSSDLMVIHDGTIASIIEYGSIATNNMLASFTSTISGSNLLLQVNMGSSTSATVKVVRYGISI